MIFLIAQTKGFLQSFQWKTCQPIEDNAQIFDALVSCSSQSVNHNLALLSHPKLNSDLLGKIEQEVINKGITNLMIISRDQSHQADLQKLLASHTGLLNVNKIVFGIHQDLYKSGIDEVQWSNVAGQHINLLSQSNAVTNQLAAHNPIFTDIHAA